MTGMSVLLVYQDGSIKRTMFHFFAKPVAQHTFQQAFFSNMSSLAYGCPQSIQRQQVCDTSSGPSPSTRQHVCDSLHLAPVYLQGRCVTRFICPQSIHKTAGLCLASSVPSIHMTCFIWPPSLGLLDMGGPASSQATIGIALRVTEALKSLYHFKVVSQQRGKWIYLNTIPQLIKSYNSGQLK